MTEKCILDGLDAYSGSGHCPGCAEALRLIETNGCRTQEQYELVRTKQNAWARFAEINARYGGTK